MDQCIRAAEGMLNTRIPPPPEISSLKRSLSDISGDFYGSSKRQAVMSPAEAAQVQSYPTPVRGYAAVAAHPTTTASPQPVHIQPRPSNGYATSPPSVCSPPVSVTAPNVALPPARRRGRPPKVKDDALARQHGSQTTTYAPISPAPPPPPRSPGPQAIAPAPQLPGHGGGPHSHPSYLHSTASTTKKKGGRQPATMPEKQQTPPESVPRGVPPHSGTGAAFARAHELAGKPLPPPNPHPPHLQHTHGEGTRSPVLSEMKKEGHSAVANPA
jgi:hypothetical protein